MKNARTAQNARPDGFVFSVRDVSSGRRRNAWMDFVEGRFLSLKFDNLHLGGRDRIICKTADTAKLSFIASGPQTVVRRSHDIHADAVDDVFLNYQVRGNCLSRQAGRETILTEGSVTFLDGSKPYSLEFKEDFQHFVVHLPRSYASTIVPSFERLCGMTLDKSSLAGNLAVTNLQQLASAFWDLTPAATAAISETIMKNALVGLVERDPDGDKQSGTYHRAITVIRGHLGESELSPRSIATALNCSVRHLHLSFAGSERTVSQEILFRRLEAAKRILAYRSNDRLTVDEVAFGCGFKSTSHFISRFKDATGLTPREYRHESTRDDDIGAAPRIRRRTS